LTLNQSLALLIDKKGYFTQCYEWTYFVQHNPLIQFGQNSKSIIFEEFCFGKLIVSDI
jgi:hypothetical protein